MSDNRKWILFCPLVWPIILPFVLMALAGMFIFWAMDVAFDIVGRPS